MSLPQTFAKAVGRDGWIVALLLLLADFICLCFVAWAIKLNKNKLTFAQITKDSIGMVFSKIVQAIFALFIVVRLITLYSGVYELFVATFGIRTNWMGFALPLAMFVLFAVSKGMQPIARANQLLAPLIVLSLVAILALPSAQVEIDELLPIAEDGFSKILSTAATNGFWFSDYLFLYFVMDGVKKQKRHFLPILGFFCIGGLLTLFMYMLFTGLFGKMAPYTDLAMSKVSQFVVTTAVNGRVDWLFVTIWTASVFIKILVFTFSLYKTLVGLFGVKGYRFNYAVGIVSVAVIVLPLFVTVNQLSQIVSKWLCYPFYVIQYLLPLLMPLLVKLANVKTHKNNVVGVGVNEDA